MLGTTTRILLIAIGVLLTLGGLLAIAEGGSDAALAGIWLVVGGLILVAAPVFERIRYRSLTAERSDPSYGPGGGEPAGPLEARFEPTDEVFVDPTSGHRMRVHLDRRTGERRYVAED